jgi:hypothetical protein
MKRFLCNTMLAATLAVPAVDTALADASNFLTLTEQSSTHLLFQSTILTKSSSGDGLSDGDAWILGGFPFFIPKNGLNQTVFIPEVAWIEPGGDPAHPENDLFNLLDIVPNGSAPTTFLVTSDVTFRSLGASGFNSAINFFKGCGADPITFQPNIECPILSNDQSIEVPMVDPGGTPVGTLTVTFHDQGDVAGTSSIPEPGTLTLFSGALLALGAIRRRRTA